MAGCTPGSGSPVAVVSCACGGACARHEAGFEVFLLVSSHAAPPAGHVLPAARATWRLRGAWRWCAAPTTWATSCTSWGCTSLRTQVGHKGGLLPVWRASGRRAALHGHDCFEPQQGNNQQDETHRCWLAITPAPAMQSSCMRWATPG